jgi:hypothetical protein
LGTVIAMTTLPELRPMIPSNNDARAEVGRPLRAVRRPQRFVLALAPIAALAAVTAACANNDANQVEDPVVLGMSDTAPVYYRDEQITIYEVQTQVPLPVRPPSDIEKQGLTGDVPPYPRPPFLRNTDERVEVRYTITNLDDAQHSVELLLDPWNEFARWEPGITVVNDETTVPNTSGYDKFLVVPGKSRVEGTITPDDTNELAVDLATAMAILKNPPAADAAIGTGTMLNHVFDLQNRSNDGDPLISGYIPSVIAGISGFDLGLRTYETANVAVEIIVDFTDLNGQRAVQTGSTQTPMGRPGKALMPPGARQGS